MKTFFITGLPRSRSSWMANFLTWGTTMCFHDGFVGYDLVGGLVAKMKAWKGDCVGHADPMNALFTDQLAAEFPDAKWVVVLRNPDDARQSSEKAFGWPADTSRAQTEVVREKLGDVILLRNPMLVYFDDINYDVAMSVARHVNPDWDCPRERAEMLCGFNVQLEAERLKTLIASNPVSPQLMEQVERPVTSEANKAYMALVREICGNDATGEAAWKWFIELCEVAHVWDHCVDGDVVNPAQADRVFYALTMGWHRNKFFDEHKDMMLAAMSLSIKAWKGGMPYTVYTLIPDTIGLALQRPVPMGRLFELVGQLKAEDERKDETWAPQ